MKRARSQHHASGEVAWERRGVDCDWDCSAAHGSSSLVRGAPECPLGPPGSPHHSRGVRRLELGGSGVLGLTGGLSIVCQRRRESRDLLGSDAGIRANRPAPRDDMHGPRCLVHGSPRRITCTKSRPQTVESPRRPIAVVDGEASKPGRASSVQVRTLQRARR